MVMLSQGLLPASRFGVRLLLISRRRRETYSNEVGYHDVDIGCCVPFGIFRVETVQHILPSLLCLFVFLIAV